MDRSRAGYKAQKPASLMSVCLLGSFSLAGFSNESQTIVLASYR
jgi:hypothetical protein